MELGSIVFLPYQVDQSGQIAILATGVVCAALLALVIYLLRLTGRLKQMWDEQAMRIAGLEQQASERERELQHLVQTLEDEHNCFDSLAASSFEGVAIHQDGKILEANQVFLDLFGYDRTEIPTMNIPELVTADCLPVVRENIDQQQTEPYEIDIVKKGGSILPVEVRGRTIQHHGRSARVVSMRDIHEQKNVETTLRQLSRAVEQSAATIVITDTNGIIEFVNPAFEHITGYSMEEVIGQNPRVLKSGLTPQETYADMWKAISSGNVWQGELVNRKKNGDLYWENAIISPVRDDNGKITHYLAIKDDITGRKSIEAALRERNEELEALQVQLREQSIRDPLTGAYNRRFLAEILDKELVRAERSQYPVSLLMIDIDHFKDVNDTYGHPVGDEALKTLVEVVENKVRHSDIICRYGGEEFVVILPQTTSADALRRAEYIRRILQDTFNHLTDHGRPVTVSIGVASAGSGEASDNLISRADRALYQAKDAGRNCVILED